MRARTWNGAPSPRPGRAFDQPDPTSGRHALDEEAALTPIFTSLRRRGPLPPAAPGPGLRLAPPPHDRLRDSGPPTAPIPLVPPLYAVAPHRTGGYDAYVPPAQVQDSGGWAAGAYADPYEDRYDGDGYDAGYHHRNGYDGRYEVDGYEDDHGDGYAADGYADGYVDARAGGYGVDGYGVDGYGVDGYAVDAHGVDGHGSGGYRAGSVDPYARSRFVPVPPAPPAPQGSIPWQDSVPQDATQWWRRPDAVPPRQVTDTGRHHHRLAPAGW